MNWLRQRKIAPIRSGDSGPVAYLAQLLEQAQAGHIKSVVVSVQYDNGFIAGSMKMPISDLLMHKATIDEHVDDHFRGSK